MSSWLKLGHIWTNSLPWPSDIDYPCKKIKKSFYCNFPTPQPHPSIHCKNWSKSVPTISTYIDPCDSILPSMPKRKTSPPQISTSILCSNNLFNKSLRNIYNCFHHHQQNLMMINKALKWKYPKMTNISSIQDHAQITLDKNMLCTSQECDEKEPRT